MTNEKLRQQYQAHRLLDWISYIKSDENKALKEIYKSYREESIAWLRKQYKLDGEPAKEIFQISVIILYDNVMSGKLTKLSSSLKSYLFAISKNKAAEYHRQQNKTTGLTHLPTLVDYVDQTREKKNEKENKLENVNKAMLSLGDPCRSILQLFYYKSMNMESITGLLGYKNVNTTKNLKYKCIKRLQKYLLEH